MASPAPPIPSGGRFDFSGGELCLDFTNTWADRARPETDQLLSYADLREFAGQAGVLDPPTDRQLNGRAERDPDGARRALDSARSLRDALYALLSAQARGRPWGAGDLDRLNDHLAVALPHLRLQARGNDFLWAWADRADNLASPLWPVLHSAVHLLTGPDRTLVRECDGAQCTWLFLDRSRSRSRRWCSMASCGNRAKARRHYHRKAQE